MTSPPHTIAVVGATGTTGSRVVRLLAGSDHPVRPLSRSGSPRFDWSDENTFAAALDGVGAIYLVPPVGSADPAPAMGALVREGIETGVRRFVLLSAAVIDRGSPGVGEIHDLLATEAPEWAVLRPSWFMQNLQRGHYLGDQAVTAGRLPTSVGDGEVAFVDADDIAAVAVRALVDEPSHDTDHLITGPQALSYDDVAAILSTVGGRRIVHDRVSPREVECLMVDGGIPVEFAPMLAGLEAGLRAGEGSTVADTVAVVTGRPPRSFADWASAHADTWRAA